MNRLIRAGAAALVLLPALAAAEAPFRFESTYGLLPKDAVPVAYELHVVPDLERLTFAGEVAIRFRVLEKTRRLVLNALELDLQDATLSVDGSAPRALPFAVDAARQTVTLPLEPALPPGEYRLDIRYTGVINEHTSGLYHAMQYTPRGPRRMLSTQMEPADARRLLPCWDEPVFRATFDVSVDLPRRLTAYSNMPATSVETLPGGLRRTRFARTPKMSSYLLVLTAGETERVSARQDGVDHGVVAFKGKARTAAYALGVSRELLRYYNDYFGIAYPLPKLDHFAVPSTAGFSAMENWGGITYDEAVLLFDERTSGASAKRVIHGIVAHEMAHQWYGNLVTMAWWDNLWLNEGFASWMGSKATHHFNPDWGVWQAANAHRESAMRLDARKTTHPIQQPIRNEAEANSAFDTITYRKGQTLLRMLEVWLGEEAFRDGMRAYMAKHQYSNATTEDLWGALEQASGKPVRRMARGWVEEPGFPVLTVDARCDDGVREIVLRQEQFRVDGAPGRRLWSVPVALRAGGMTAYVLLEKRKLEVERKGCDDPVIVDPDAVGYYRVQYAPALQRELLARWDELDVDTRLKVLSDAWALAGAGRIAAPAYLEVAQRARRDREPAMWKTLLEHLKKLDEVAQGQPARAEVRRFAVELLRPQLDRLGWEPKRGESQQVAELRPALIGALGQYGDPEVVVEARRRFERYLRKPGSLPAALAPPVIRIAGQYADQETFDALIRKFRAATGSEEQKRFLFAAAHAEDPALAQQALALALDPTVNAAQAVGIPAYVADEHPALTWAFVQEHQATLRGRLPALEFHGYFGYVLSAAADERLADELEAWAKRTLPEEGRRQTHRHADGIRFNARLRERLLPELVASLDKASAS